MSVFDEAKTEIVEMLKLAKRIELFDSVIMYYEIKPTKEALRKRKGDEIRYVELLKKYT